MDAPQILADAVGRIRGQLHVVADGLGPAALNERAAPGANPIGWILWHLTRVQDTHVAELLEAHQLYVEGGWADRLGLRADTADTGYGHVAAQVEEIRIGQPGELVGYHDAVAARSLDLLAGLVDDDLDRIVDESWDPPVTAGVRWVSIVEDCMQHIGQAAYARGLLDG